MAKISAYEYLNTLIDFYEATDKLYMQAEADVVVATKRRDEAKNMKNKVWNRLAEARKKCNVTDSDVTKTVVRKSSLRNREHGEKTPSPRDNDGNKSDNQFSPDPFSPDPFSPQTYPPLHEEDELKNKRNQLQPIPDLDSQAVAPTGPRNRKPRKLSSPGGRSRKMGHSIPKQSRSIRTVKLESKNINVPIFEICRGRAPEWYESNLKAESLGLVKRFYQAALGTKTHAATNQVYISSVLLNDEYHTMVTMTSEVQELYIGVSKTSDGKETLRDRAARALVQPPQKEPVAIFFAPRNTKFTGDVFYGGHWKVVAGNMLEPPRIVKGTPRQCLVKFEFCGVNPDIVKAVNGE